MREFEIGSFVSFDYRGRTGMGVVEGFTAPDKVRVRDFSKDKAITISEKFLTPLPDDYLSIDKLKSYFLFLEEFPEDYLSYDNYFEPEKIVFNIEFLLQVLKNMKNCRNELGDGLFKSRLQNWLHIISCYFHDEKNDRIEFSFSTNADCYGLMTEDAIFNYIMSELDGYSEENSHSTIFDVDRVSFGTDINLDSWIKDVRSFIDNRDLPLNEKEFSTLEKTFFIHLWRDPMVLRNSGNELVYKLYRRFVEELCEIKDFDGLVTAAYAYYSGDEVFEKDVIKSRDYFLELMETHPSGYFANSLGYIFYYGRDTGVPDYNKAFKYFSIGNAAGIIESRYKLADLMYNGLGVEKMEDIASKMYLDLYDEQKKDFLDGKHTKFADLAIRVAGLFENGVFGFIDYNFAYMHYLQAEFALKLREKDDYVGDGQLRKKVKESKKSLREKLRLENNSSVAVFKSLNNLLFGMVFPRDRFSCKVNKSASEVSFTITNARKHNGGNKKLFVSFNTFDFSGFVNEVFFVAKNARELYFKSKNITKSEGCFTFEFDSITDRGFYDNNRPVFELFCDGFELKRASLLDEKEYSLVEIHSHSDYFEAICNLDVEFGDIVLVEMSPDYVEEGEVVNKFSRKSNEMLFTESGYPVVIEKIKV